MWGLQISAVLVPRPSRYESLGLKAELQSESESVSALLFAPELEPITTALEEE